MVSIAVGLITGLVALAIAHGQGMVFGDEVGASAASFFIGFMIDDVGVFCGEYSYCLLCGGSSGVSNESSQVK